MSCVDVHVCGDTRGGSVSSIMINSFKNPTTKAKQIEFPSIVYKGRTPLFKPLFDLRLNLEDTQVFDKEVANMFSLVTKTLDKSIMAYNDPNSVYCKFQYHSLAHFIYYFRHLH